MSNLKYVLIFIWKDRTLRLLLSASLVIVILMVIFVTGSRADPGVKFRYLPKGTIVLAFIGNPTTLDLVPVRLTSYEDQRVQFFHRRSGPGLHTFYLRGFRYKTDEGYEVIRDHGYFMVHKRKLRVGTYSPKLSMKTKKE